MQRLNITKQEVHKEKPFAHLVYSIKGDVDQNLNKTFVGRMKLPGMSYTILYEFYLQWYFVIKVTPLGSNLCLLEEQEEGEMLDLYQMHQLA